MTANNTLEDLKRLPSDLRRYLQWSYKTKLTYGSITNFVVQERLRWQPSHGVTTDQPVTATSFTHYSEVPFQDERDYAVLINDWPYGLVSEITHIVVWSRTPIAVDDHVGDVTSESRALISAFVQQYFVAALATDCASESEAAARVLWFKNWGSLQSVRGIDHVHVLVRGASRERLLDWTSSNPTDY